MKPNPSNYRENDSYDFLRENYEATFATTDDGMNTRSLQTQPMDEWKSGKRNRVDDVHFEW